MNQGYTHRETVLAEHAGRTLLDHLVRRWRHGGEGAWTARLERGEVALRGVRAAGGERLAVGDELSWSRPPWEEPDVPLCFALLHRERDWIAVAKPAGLPTMPSGGRFLDHTLLARVRRRWPGATPLHRLDRGTSGVVLFALAPGARRAIAEAWQRGLVRRFYRGLVQGEVDWDERMIEAPIGELPDPRLGRVFAAAERGRAARTHVHVVERRRGETLLAIEIGTGRPHQIRIHLAFAGHPLVGEPFFGDGGRPREGSDALPGDVGYLLHAERVAFGTTDVTCAAPSKLRTRDELEGRSARG